MSKLKTDSDSIHKREKMFHTFLLNGVRYLAFREYDGTTIFDDAFNNYGGFKSLESFVKRHNKESIEPIGQLETLSATRKQN